MIRTDNMETLTNALQRVQELEAENKRLRAELETATEALAGAHRVIRHQRDRDSVLPAEAFQFAPGTI
jgi:hypothetical protein